MATTRFQEHVTVLYERGLDGYTVELRRDGELVDRVDEVFFDALGGRPSIPFPGDHIHACFAGTLFSAMIAMPTNTTAAPIASQRVGVTPSTTQSQPSATAI